MCQNVCMCLRAAGQGEVKGSTLSPPHTSPLPSSTREMLQMAPLLATDPSRATPATSNICHCQTPEESHLCPQQSPLTYPLKSAGTVASMGSLSEVQSQKNYGDSHGLKCIPKIRTLRP